MMTCLEQVCEKMQTGDKCKSSDVKQFARNDDEKVFSDICPSKVNMRGKSKLKQLVAEQMVMVVSTDVSVRFESKCAKLCRSVGDLSKKSACRVVRSAFSGHWEDVPAFCELPLKRVLPDNRKHFLRPQNSSGKAFCGNRQVVQIRGKRTWSR